MSFLTSLNNLGFKDYASYLQSRHWLDFKERYARSGREQVCQGCKQASYQLHHVTYKRLGQEQLEDVMPLCAQCHDRVHDILKKAGKGVGQTNWALMQMRARNKEDKIRITKAIAKAIRIQERYKREKPSGEKKCDRCDNMTTIGTQLCKPCRKATREERRGKFYAWKNSTRVKKPPVTHDLSVLAIRDFQRELRAMTTGHPKPTR